MLSILQPKATTANSPIRLLQHKRDHKKKKNSNSPISAIDADSKKWGLT